MKHSQNLSPQRTQRNAKENHKGDGQSVVAYRIWILLLTSLRAFASIVMYGMHKCHRRMDAQAWPVKKYVLASLAALLLLPVVAHAGDIPTLSFSLGDSEDPTAWFTGLKIIAMLTVLTLAPSILVMMTSFTRILIVFAFLRQALGTQQAPPNQILIGLALFLTLFIMMPVWQKIDTTALTPYLNEEISQSTAIDRGIAPLRTFMLKQTREDDLILFLDAAKLKKPAKAEDTPLYVLIPSFVISELRTAFEIGFLIYIPFVVLDLIVASVLMSLGMMMLPPVMISLPLKIILFVLIDGWHLVTANLLASFKM